MLVPTPAPHESAPALFAVVVTIVMSTTLVRLGHRPVPAPISG